jgi:hypothetical protein
VIRVLVGTRFRTSFGPYFLIHFCMSLVHPVSARSSPRFLSWPSTSRRRAHQVGDHQQGPKAAYAPGDATPLARPISDRLGYPKRMKSPEVWDREVQCDRCGTRPAGEWIDNCWIPDDQRQAPNACATCFNHGWVHGQRLIWLMV